MRYTWERVFAFQFASRRQLHLIHMGKLLADGPLDEVLGASAATVLFLVILCDYYYFFYCVLAAIIISYWFFRYRRETFSSFSRENVIALGTFAAVGLLCLSQI